MQNNTSKNSNFHYSKTIEKIKKPNEIRVLTIEDEVIIEKNEYFLGKLIYMNFKSASTGTYKKQLIKDQSN